jgi:hypothetical protein
MAYFFCKSHDGSSAIGENWLSSKLRAEFEKKTLSNETQNWKIEIIIT